MKKKYIAEFARERKENVGTVAAYIRRNPDLFEGHTETDGKKTYLDDVAIQILNDVYPVPEEKIIVENVETIKELAAARAELAESQKQIIDLQAKILSMTERFVLADQQIHLLEDKNQQINELLQAVDDEKNRAENLQNELNAFVPSFFGFYRKKQ